MSYLQLMEKTRLLGDSNSWINFTKLSFLISLGAMGFGIAMLPLDFWAKGYLAMGLFFTVGSTVSVTKTVRDHHESQRIIHRVEEAKTEKILNDFNT